MSNALKIKVCGITSKEQTEKLNVLHVDFIGMIHHKSSPRHVEQPFDLNVTNGVLVSVNQSLNTVKTIAKSFNTKQLQLHGNESPEQCNHLLSLGFTIFKAFSIDEDFDFKACEKYINSTSYFLFDTKGASQGGNGTKFNWKKLYQYQFQKPFFLSGGISLEDAEAIKNLTTPMLVGVDINSQFEKSPGIKDLAKIEQFINILRQ